MKLLSTLTLLLFATISLLAQDPVCTPDPIYADSAAGVYPLPFEPELSPDGGINECAFVGESYFFTFNIKVDSTINFGGSSFDIDSLVLEEVNNIPTGIGFACNPVDCTFPGNSVGCVSLVGTADASNPLGEYSLEIVGRAYSGGIPIEITFPNPLFAAGEYILNLAADASDAACMTSSNDNILVETLEIQNAPNPFSQVTNIRVVSTLSGDFQFTVRDVLGNKIHQEAVRMSLGANTFAFDGTDLPNGLYVYSFSDGINVVTRKMMISHQ